MSKNSTRYSEEFKQQIVDLYNSGSSVTYLSSEYGVSNITIYSWIKQLSPVKVSEKDELNLKDYGKMKKRIAELEMENKILKKLLLYS
ncbi:transposase [Anaerocolumna chitinilytica]|uniref:Transposase n=1 Tax=Anaerocolumna chitinilytica TaxID=1727145 RepID=A0A7I8DUM6_9FIRM|nr:transposase [Anaerocolumna chitinilytica]BCK00826.1 transposase [Anaerocolumna chitinilytica]